MDLTQFQTFRVAACDLNGRMRGKRLPASHGDKLGGGTLRMPLSSLNLDVFGADIENSPLVFETGDIDGCLFPTERGAVPLPWLDVPQALVPMVMHTEDGAPFAGDPRHALAAVLDRYATRGWEVFAATELEFTLVDPSGKSLKTVRDPRSGRRIKAPGILSLGQMDAFDAFLSDLYSAGAEMEIPVETAISEAGIGQFELTLHHQSAMRAADDTWLFKTMIKGLARQHGYVATFMAKPFADDTGNGMHMHFSVLDGEGHNVFDDGTERGTDTLRSAVAGCLAAMPPSTLIFAPHANSYARLVPGAHAPTGAGWGYENRTAAVRIPGGPNAARRIEHRVAGGDINPYLSFAAILGAAITGIEDGMTPPAPITGNAYEADLPQLAADWGAAIDLFEADPLIARIFPAELIRNLVMTKRQEHAHISKIDAEDHWKTYLETV
ncbi:Gamma-glutamylputrescine synthetase PuuA [Roseovarius tolerans]|uniref:Gamma-glutamylputrescine synthetase PuuA n=1 Tax=Roseovarius tolerans TaxID=74031 RepID=A0A0L6CWZ9_9RHOB|nr:glutamine synthetase family protein [Roseovarius tolerans]KNX42185.1 Gamma-glutamylputrescine synthetase PuuA [Roseovarius tolerans]